MTLSLAFDDHAIKSSWVQWSFIHQFKSLSNSLVIVLLFLMRLTHSPTIASFRKKLKSYLPVHQGIPTCLSICPVVSVVLDILQSQDIKIWLSVFMVMHLWVGFIKRRLSAVKIQVKLGLDLCLLTDFSMITSLPSDL